MLTFKQMAKHLRDSHRMNERQILKAAVQGDGDLTAAHDEFHNGNIPAGHSHETDGSITVETKTVLTDKSITMTAQGWSFDSTASEALNEFNSIINNRNVIVKFDSDVNDGTVTASMESEFTFVNVVGGSFLEAVRLMLGETFNAIDSA